MLLLAVFPDVSETYENVKKILDEMDLESVEYSVSADIKMCKHRLIYEFMNLHQIHIVLLLIGKPAGKPFYNCPFCDGSAPFLEPSNLYTFADLFDWHQVLQTL